MANLPAERVRALGPALRVRTLAPMLPRLPVTGPRRAGARAVATALPLVVALSALSVLAGAAPSILAGDPAALAVEAPWIPELGIALALRLDALALLFGLLIAGVGALIAVYAPAYFGDDDRDAARFGLHLSLFMLAMLGIVVADDLFVLYACWELTAISSFFLIGFDGHREEAREAARQALLVTVMGGLSLLAGAVMISSALGTSRISEIVARGGELRAHPLYVPVLVTIAAGAATKSAQVPFHGWLPRAMEAPTPASAYLHAATMVKAGVYLLARLSPALAGTPEWTALFTTLGAITMVVGAVRALGERAWKPALAYATVSSLGLFVLLLGVGSPRAIEAALAYLAAHALYKGALFLFAGAVTHQTGCKDAEDAHGLLRAMPRTSASALLAAASMAGVPITLGFLGKDLAIGALLQTHGAIGASLAVGVVATSALFTAVAVALAVRPLLGRRSRASPAPRGQASDPAIGLWLPPLVLASLGVIAAVLPAPLDALLRGAAAVVRRGAGSEPLLEPHAGVELALGLAALAAGVLLFAARAPLRALGGRVAAGLGLRPARGYEASLRALRAIAQLQTRPLQNGPLGAYVRVTVLVAALAVLSGLLGAGAVPTVELGDARLEALPAVLGAFVVAAALVAARATSRFTSIAALGVVGFGVSLLFLELGAPDLAMTQFAVESLVMVVFVLAFHHLPELATRSSRAARVRDLAVAIASGGTMAALVLLAGRTARPERPISTWYLEHALPDGHGANVVNVILTDFRSVDTLGEIVVLVTASFGGLAMLRLRLRDGARPPTPAEPPGPGART